MLEILFSSVLAILLMNMIVGFIHIKIFLKEFQGFRNKGKVLIGQQKNIFKNLSTIMFLLDSNNVIIKTKYAIGFELFPKFKETNLLTNRPVSDIKYLMPEIKQLNKKLVGAVQDALKKWQKFLLS